MINFKFLMLFFADHSPEKFSAVSSSGTSRGRSSMNDPGENRSYAKLSDQEYLMLKVITSFIKEPKEI